MNSESRYLHLIRQDCPLPPASHVFIYCRDSGGDEQDRSVQQQIETAREYCLHHNLVIDDEFIDEAKVSSNTDKRTALQEMLLNLRQRFRTINDRYKREKIAAESPFGVIFWKSNRLGRDSIEATHIKTDLRLRGITLIDLVTSANTGNTAIDALIEAFQQWQDEQTLDEISQNAKRGLAQLVATRDNDPEFLKYNPDWPSTGGYLGVMPGAVPRGFKAERIQIGVFKRKKGRNAGEARIVQRIVPDPEMWDRCLLAWKMRREGASYGEVHAATKLFRNAPSYDTFFRNPIYTGTLRFGDVLYENFVPAMIPKEWFDDEQVHRAERNKKHEGQKMDPRQEPRRVGSNYLLSGLVMCGHVDGEEHAMNVEHIPAQKGKRGAYTFFICMTSKNSRRQRCDAKRVSVRSLDKAVIDNLLENIVTVENLRPIAREIAQKLNERTRDASIRLDALEAELEEVQTSLENIMDAIEKMGYAKHLQARYDTRKREEEALIHEISVLKSLQVRPKDLTLISDRMLEQWIEHIRTALESEDKSLARRMIRQFVAKIVVKQGTGTLYYTFPLPDGLYMPSLRDLDLKRLELLTSTVRL